jgi:hypothetical protein
VAHYLLGMSELPVGGWLAGLVLSPITGAVSALRRSRMFHPRGIVCRALVQPLPGTAALEALANSLAGPALVRWSSAWWKLGELTDVLGCAIRFSSDPLDTEPRATDQDLLLATIQRPWSMPFAPWTTHQHDFLANDYYGVSPFEVAGRRVEWRLRPEHGSPFAATRAERLRLAMRSGSAELRLELAPYAGALHEPKHASFESVARLRLEGLIDIDQEALEFDPFRAGRGLTPVGFVHAMRKATYRLSQRARRNDVVAFP